MRYYKISKETCERSEITYEEARRLVAKDYSEKVCTYAEMLSMRGVIPSLFFYIEIEE